MTDQKKNITAFLKPNRLFRRQKEKPKTQALSSVNHFPDEDQTVSTGYLPDSRFASNDFSEAFNKLSVQEVPQGIASNIPDDFDLYLKLSKSPTSKLLNQQITSATQKRKSNTENVLGARQDISMDPSYDILSKATKLNEKFTDDSGRSSRSSPAKSSKAEAVTSQVGQQTRCRKELARASFRSRSVRERGTTKKLHAPQMDPDEPINIDPYYLYSPGLDGEVIRHQSLATVPCFCPTSGLGLCRVRSFKMTNKGVVNLGDTVHSSSTTGLQTDTEPYAFMGCPFHSSRSDGNRSSFALPPQAGAQLTGERQSRRAISMQHHPQFCLPDGDFVKSQPQQLDWSHVSRQRAAKSSKDVHSSGESLAKRSMVIHAPSEGITRIRKRADHQSIDNKTIRIQVAGSSNVGKTSLCRQLTTSEYLGARIESISEDTVERYVTVELDQQAWNIVLIDNFGEADAYTNLEADLAGGNRLDSVQYRSECGADANRNILQVPQQATSADGGLEMDSFLVLLVVYAVDDPASYEYASQLLCDAGSLKKEANRQQVVVLVANKSDLVRSRLISAEKGKRLSQIHGCKYFEISTTLNHLVDELLVAVILEVIQLCRRNSLGDRQQRSTKTAGRRVQSFIASSEAVVRYLRTKFGASSYGNLVH